MRFVDGLYTYRGSDEPEVSSDGRPGENSFYDNIISNTETGVKIKEGDNTIITGKTESKSYRQNNPACIISPFPPVLLDSPPHRIRFENTHRSPLSINLSAQQ